MLQDGSPTLKPESSTTKTEVDLVDQTSNQANGECKVLVIMLEESADKSKTTLYYMNFMHFKFNELFLFQAVLRVTQEPNVKFHVDTRPME